MHKIWDILKSNNGAALVFVLIVFLTLSILVMSALFITTTNTRQITTYKDNMIAHYVAFSGIELGFASLYTDTASEDLLEKLKSGSITKLGPDNVSIGENGDIAEVQVEINNEKTAIIITSTGIINSGTKSKTLQMSFPVDYPELQKWIEK